MGLKKQQNGAQSGQEAETGEERAAEPAQTPRRRLLCWQRRFSNSTPDTAPGKKGSLLWIRYNQSLAFFFGSVCSNHLIQTTASLVMSKVLTQPLIQGVAAQM